MEILLYVIIPLALSSIIFYFILKRIPKKEVYEFQDWEKTDMPYITINVQDNKLNMIADSAASVCIIQKEALKRLHYIDSSRKVNLTALDDEGVTSNVVSIPFNVNGKEINIDFVVYDSDNIAGFSQKHGVTIHGLLGVEFFRKTKGNVDFNKQTVTLL